MIRIQRLSLAHKLSILTGSVIAFCVIVVLVATYETLTRSALAGMRSRLVTATTQLAGDVQARVRQGSSRYTAIAHDTRLRQILQRLAADSDSTIESRGRQLRAARDLLARLLIPSDAGLRVDLYDNAGRRLLVVTSQAQGLPANEKDATGGTPRALRDAMDSAGNKDSLRLSRLYVVDGSTYFWFVHAVVDKGVALGYIAEQRRIAANAQTDRSMRALAGEGVDAYYANGDGSVWTTLGGKLVASRPLPPARAGSGDLIASAPVPGTPLAIVMASNIDYVLATSRSTLVQLIAFGVILSVTGMAAALVIGRRMVVPIVAIADAAEEVARGHYDVRVASAREIELARLADSFNHMANEVAAGDEARREIAHIGRVAAVAELASSITHELRQPLTAIQANSDSAALLLRRPDPDVEHAAECVESILSDCDRAAGVINHIRVLIRKDERITTTVDLNRICRDAVHLLRQDAALRRTEVELSLTPDTLTVAGDPVQLQQLVINLTLNALDAASAMRGQRRVTVSTATVNAAAEITVRDSGPGVPIEIHDRLFEPFFTTKSHGLGMGLTIVRSIAERHHGRVHAENAIDAGAVFTVTLPATVSPAAARENYSMSFAASPFRITDI